MSDQTPEPVSDSASGRDAGPGSAASRRKTLTSAPLVTAFEIGRRLNRLQWNQRHAVFCGSRSHQAAARKDLRRLQEDLTSLFLDDRGGDARLLARNELTEWGNFLDSAWFAETRFQAYRTANHWSSDYRSDELIDSLRILTPNSYNELKDAIREAFKDSREMWLACQLGSCIDELVRCPDLCEHLIVEQPWNVGHVGCELRLMYSLEDIADIPIGCQLIVLTSVQDAASIPQEGRDCVVVARVGNVLHFRIFDREGCLVVDTEEKKLTESADHVQTLKKLFLSLCPPHELTENEKAQIVDAVERVTPGKLAGYGLRLMTQVKDVSEIPVNAEDNLIIMAIVDDVLHLRVFDDEGTFDVKTDETKLTEPTRQIEALRELLAKQRLTASETCQIISAIRTLVDCDPNEHQIIVSICMPEERLHLRIIGPDGAMAVARDEEQLTHDDNEQGRERQISRISDLKDQLKQLRLPHWVTGREKSQVVDAVCTIVDYTPYWDQLRQEKKRFREINKCSPPDFELVGQCRRPGDIDPRPDWYGEVRSFWDELEIPTRLPRIDRTACADATERRSIYIRMVNAACDGLLRIENRRRPPIAEEDRPHGDGWQSRPQPLEPCCDTREAPSLQKTSAPPSGTPKRRRGRPTNPHFEQRDAGIRKVARDRHLERQYARLLKIVKDDESIPMRETITYNVVREACRRVQGKGKKLGKKSQ
jgi:hypothetical protein